MVHVVLVMHAPLGQAFASCAEHVLGAAPALTVFDVAPDDPIDERVEQLAALLAKSPDGGVLVLCDIFGATPFNIANRALKMALEKGVIGHLITGTNLCMVLKALTDQQQNPDELSEKVRQGALKGIVNTDCTSLS
ncbi:MAG TPA: PTS sugar transporter subunit IIA [Eoetvoesiella sp.]|jgi:PTS system ascorbate-specific IIA component|uniref:PTS sugar transporter subunit IIA n=1 Tax=Eoetvoesiella sp. TaxID=1966355 RepID=UPI002B6676D6|nr:PTS sugar transporter subunit IIA [Eoetvoesiella sp.]HWK62778.1 PTS sugar transporter subunit IIA [Eoetvoesiella sp.]